MSGGVSIAAKEAVEALPDEEEFVQGALFDDLDAADIGAMDAPSPLSGLLQPRKGPGRPRGSRNKRTEAVARWLLSQGRHPVLVMMESYGMSTVELAERIGLRKAVRIKKLGNGDEVEVQTDHFSNEVLLDLFKLQMRMAEAAAPYVAQKLPQAHEVAAQAGVTIAFAGVSLPARAGEAGNPAAIDGKWRALLPAKSDEESRTAGEGSENVEVSG